MEEEPYVYLIDVVCGAVVDPREVVHRTEHKGETYAFCGASCQRTFEDDPDKHLKAPEYGPYH